MELERKDHGGFEAALRPPPRGPEAWRRDLSASLAGTVHAPRRPRLYELDSFYHCSVVGTCFTLGELRRLVAKIGALRPGASDHEVHHDAVLIAGRRDQHGKLLSKALDRKFKAIINRFAPARDDAALRQLWDEAVARGDVPDAYWAVLTHPAASPSLLRRVFGEVHMLSHLVGAANRADIRRLQLLERENDALRAKLDRQQRHLNGTLGAKEQRIRELEGLLAQRPDAVATPDAASAALAETLRRETRRRMRLEARVAALLGRLATATGRPATAAPPCPGAADTGAPAADVPEPDDAALRPRLPDLAGAALLVIGGRAGQVPALARAVADAGGNLLHHDGGLEMSLGLLPGLVGRADRVLLALDCVSHAAADAARRLALGTGKPCVPLRRLSLAALARAVEGGTAAAA